MEFTRQTGEQKFEIINNSTTLLKLLLMDFSSNSKIMSLLKLEKNDQNLVILTWY